MEHDFVIVGDFYKLLSHPYGHKSSRYMHYNLKLPICINITIHAFRRKLALLLIVNANEACNTFSIFADSSVSYIDIIPEAPAIRIHQST